jgi:hypothetical protein
VFTPKGPTIAPIGRPVKLKTFTILGVASHGTGKCRP